jgi:hypothetical protein
LTEEVASAAVNMLCETLAFAPKSDLARVLITKALMKMCYTEEDAFWLVERAANLHTNWDTCGIPGLRQILSSRGMPKDGVSISCTSAYPEGIPLEHPGQKPEPFLLSSGQPIGVGSTLNSVPETRNEEPIEFGKTACSDVPVHQNPNHITKARINSELPRRTGAKIRR